MADKDLKALLLHQLKDTYYAENAITKALPKLMAAAKSPDLKAAFEVHLDETRSQIKRLDQIFKLLGQQAEAMKCEAIEGIISEGEEVIEAFAGGEALDADLIASAQAIEHYEIARYGTMLAWSKQLEIEDVAALIEETLIEEENTDQLLSELAEDAINPRAAA